MNISRALLSLPMKRQTVIGALIMATVLFIVYQFTFVAELTESSIKAQKHDVGEQQQQQQQAGRRRQSHGQRLHKRKHSRDTRLRKHDALSENGKIGVESEGIKGNSDGGEKIDSARNEVQRESPQDNVQSEKKVKTKQESAVLTFRCEKSGKTVTVDKLNDNYCDCPEDGSDEPRTNACVNGRFTCLKHVKSFPESIPSGWVNDGVCDCCDGSDEWNMKKSEADLSLHLQSKIGLYLSPCPDQCPGAA